MTRSASLSFLIGGRRWRWVYRSMRSCWGLCDYSSRTIAIDASRQHAGRLLLDTEIHEALHALQAFATEEHTAEVATTLADILWGLGYRRTGAAPPRAYLGD